VNLPRTRLDPRARLAPAAVVAALAVFSAVSALSPSALGSSARARTAAHVTVGLSDNSPAIFTDPRTQWLGIRVARIVLAWNVVDRRQERTEANLWLTLAKIHGVKPLVVFEKDPVHPGHLPTLAQYGKAVRAFMKLYPWVTDYSPWNEENHYLQPTATNPQRAAQYFNLVSVLCKTCSVTAADVLDIPNMSEWTRRFLHFAHHPRLWGLHTYTDLSAGEHWRTALFLSIVPGQVWFTETGGVVWRYEHSNHSYVVHNEAYAAQVAGHLLGLASISGRITRIYYYQWRVPETLSWARRHGKLTWDSGLVRPDCSVRPAFGVIARAMGRNVRRIPLAHKDRYGNCV
jgi:polysaccharide biosynthesis protein PslG